MMNRTNKSIPKAEAFFRLRSGSLHLIVDLVIGLLLISSVIIYQVLVARALKQKPLLDGRLYNQVQVFVQTLPVLQGGAVYELRLEGDAPTPVSLGKFRVVEGAKIADLSGKVFTDPFFALPKELRQVRSASLCINASAQAVASVCVPFVQGSFVGERSVLSFDQDRFKQAMGEYMLATPTDGDAQVNENSGIWFGNVNK